jgi:hypothetical protein
MSTKIAIAAKIRPGKRERLQQVLAEGPPFDLEVAGFERHSVYLGDSDIFFLWEGPAPVTAVKRLAAEGGLMSHVVKMAGLVSEPHLLAEVFTWDRSGDLTEQTG